MRCHETSKPSAFYSYRGYKEEEPKEQDSWTDDVDESLFPTNKCAPPSDNSTT